MDDPIHAIEGEVLTVATGRWWVKPLLYVVGALIVGTIAYFFIYRIFLAPIDSARNAGNATVAGERATATDHTVAATLDAVNEKQTHDQQVHVIVEQGRSKINDSWHGETVGDDVDAAGAAALCSLHQSLCRLPPSTEVQPVHGRFPDGNVTREDPGGQEQ